MLRVFIILLIAMPAFAASAQNQAVAITHVTLIDGTGSPARADMTERRQLEVILKQAAKDARSR